VTNVVQFKRNLSLARRYRTILFTQLMIFVDHCLHAPVNTYRLDGLPSWWPFWSDGVKDITQQLVRQARIVARLEGREL
jgi:hypothetical protein